MVVNQDVTVEEEEEAHTRSTRLDPSDKFVTTWGEDYLGPFRSEGEI